MLQRTDILVYNLRLPAIKIYRLLTCFAVNFMK